MYESCKNRFLVVLGLVASADVYGHRPVCFRDNFLSWWNCRFKRQSRPPSAKAYEIGDESVAWKVRPRRKYPPYTLISCRRPTHTR